jgi:hypothetical protein
VSVPWCAAVIAGGSAGAFLDTTQAKACPFFAFGF